MREIEFAKRLHRFLKLLQTGALQGLDRFTANTKNLGDFLHLEPRKLKTYDFLCTMRQICHLTLQTTIQLDYSVFVVVFKITAAPPYMVEDERINHFFVPYFVKKGILCRYKKERNGGRHIVEPVPPLPKPDHSILNNVLHKICIRQIFERKTPQNQSILFEKRSETFYTTFTDSIYIKVKMQNLYVASRSV